MGNTKRTHREEVRRAHALAHGLMALGGNQPLHALIEKAAVAFQAPMAAISVASHDHIAIPIRWGIDIAETPRDSSFCAAGIDRWPATTCVPDATRDPRYAESPLVTGPLKIRFYAGAPLPCTDAMALAMLGVADTRPRPPLTAAEDVLLRDFGRRAVEEIARTQDILQYGPAAADRIVDQIKSALASDDEPLLIELDRVLRGLEQKMSGQASRRPRSHRPILPPADSSTC